MIEKNFESYQFTFSAIGAIATAIAVFIALTQHKSKLKAIFEFQSITILVDDSFPKIPPIENNSIIIANKGLLPVFIINQFSLRFPFSDGLNIYLENPQYEDDFFRIEPRKSKAFGVDLTKEGLKKIKENVGWLNFYFLWGEIQTEDGMIFKVRNTNNRIKSILKINKNNP